MKNSAIMDLCLFELQSFFSSKSIFRKDKVTEIVAGLVTILYKYEDDGGLYIQAYYDGVPLSGDDSLTLYNIVKDKE